LYNVLAVRHPSPAHLPAQEPTLPAQQTRHNARAEAPGGQQPRGAAALTGNDNFYKLLNVPYDASTRDITKAYRQAMMRAHPDRVLPEHRSAAEDLAKLLNRAYATLSNPTKRQIYDRSIRADVVQDEIMGRYVGGFAGPGMGGRMQAAHAPRRQMTESERRDRRRTDRSAWISLFSAFAVITIGLIGLLVLFALASLAISLIV
jgi:hypothetical protein